MKDRLDLRNGEVQSGVLVGMAYVGESKEAARVQEAVVVHHLIGDLVRVSTEIEQHNVRSEILIC